MRSLLLCLVIFCGFQTVLAQEEAISFEANVESLESILCFDERPECFRAELRRTDGHAPETFTVELSPTDFLGGEHIGFAVGDDVVVQSQRIDGQTQYFISDIVRRTALFWLLIAFLASVVVFGGWAAVRSFLGMAFSFVVLFAFILPQILHGRSPLLISILGSLVIMAVTFVVAHGWNRKTHAALIGTAISLLLTGILSLLFSGLAAISGFGSEEVLFLLDAYPNLNTHGVLLAGIIIGSLGVLDDITIAQASAVFELRAANTVLSAQELYRRALRIGKDHISAAVNTLILAYAGSALPLLLLLTGVPAGESWFILINREQIAAEIIRMLVGSMGLLAAVPLTTFVASWLAVRSRARTLADGA